MVGLGAGRVDVQKAFLPQLQAVVHVVVGNGELFLVQTAKCTVERGFRHQAGTGHGHVILRRDQAVHIADGRAGVTLVAVARAAVDAHEYARVLDRVVRVVELRAHRAHIGPLAVAQQLAQKVRRQNLDIIVQQQQVLALGKRRAKVVDSREIERSFPLKRHDPAGREPVMQRFIVGEGSRVGRVILDDDGLKIVIPGVFVQTCKAAVQVVGVVLVGNQHADFRVAGQLVLDLERAGCIGHSHGVPRQAETFELRVDGPLPRRDGVGLGLHASGGGTRVAAPDIEHLFDMLDAMRFFGQAQN